LRKAALRRVMRDSGYRFGGTIVIFPLVWKLQ
jgi:hypothetical protein